MVERREVFVGRKRELAELTTSLEAAIGGRGRLVMLVGEPGIGKTRTAEELSALAHERGAEVLWGRCPEESGAPPFWPWIQILRECSGHRSAKTLRSELGSGAPDIAGLVPEISERLRGLRSSPALERAEAARFRLFDSVVAFFRRASQSSPLVMIIDDLHWADASSLRLLEFAAQELSQARVLLLCTYRDADISRGHPLFRALGALTRLPAFQRVLLRGLGQREVGDMIAAAAGGRPPDRFAALVRENTEGNPLFVREIVYLLGYEGLLESDRLSDLTQLDIRLPEGIREVIGRRLDGLSTECMAALQVASVVGREFSVDLVVRLMAPGSADRPEVLPDALDEAAAARIIETIAGRPGTYRFCHALIQRTLAEELPPTRRVRLHALVGTKLEEAYAERAISHAAELAYHFGAAETVVGPEKVARYAAAAGAQALVVHGFEEAVEHFERARDVIRQAPQGPLIGDVFYGLGRAQLALNRYNDAIGNFRQAFRLAVESRDITRIVEIVATTAHSTDYALAMGDLIEEAITKLPTDSAAAARVLANYGFFLGSHRDGHSRAAGAFEKAVSIARGLGDTSLEATALVNYAMVDGRHLRWRECVEKCRKVLVLIEGHDQADSAMKANGWAASLLSWLGEPAAVQAHTNAASVAAASLRDRRWISATAYPAAGLACFKGEWAEARRWADHGLTANPLEPILLSIRAYLEYETGHESEGAETLGRLVANAAGAPVGSVQAWQTVSFSVAHAYVLTGSTTHMDRARGLAEATLTSSIVTPTHDLSARLGLARIAAVDHDQAAAARLYPRLMPLRGRITYAFITTDRALGLLARTMGRLQQAVGHFEDALSFCRAAGYLPELAWTCHDYAQMLLEDGIATGRVGAVKTPRPQGSDPRALIQQGQDITAPLGMGPLHARLQVLKDRSTTRERNRYPGDLSSREVEVLRLVATGKSNRDIAGALSISVFTVNRHVTNIFAKIRAANRAEAVAYASKHGLLA